MNPTAKLLTAEEVAKAIGRSEKTIRRWRLDGVIPAEVAQGKTLRFDLERVREALRKDANQH